MNNDWVIQATGVHKVYHAGLVSVPALRRIDTNVTRGEMLAVIGPPGGGKTTLLSGIAGVSRLRSNHQEIEIYLISAIPPPKLPPRTAGMQTWGGGFRFQRKPGLNLFKPGSNPGKSSAT